MPRPTALSRLRSPWMAALVCAAAGGFLFQFAGNATRGYVHTSSAFWWWVSQWTDPTAETQHGWIILALSAWLLWRNLRAGGEDNAECGMPNAECELNDERGTNAECRVPNAECREAGKKEGVLGAAGAAYTPTGGGRCKRETLGTRRPRRVGGADSTAESRWSALSPTRWFAIASRSSPVACVSRRRREYPGPRDSAFGIWHSAFPAFLAMLAALALHAVGFVAQQTRISIVALLLFTWGVLRLGGGRRWGRAAGFPLAFLAFAIPVNVLDSLGFWLRLWVVDAAETLARVGGFGLVRSGTQLFAADGHYQYDVAAACSGVRSLVALAALSLLVGYLSFRSPWRRALMLLLCFPLTYVGNVVRIGAIILAAQAGGQGWGERAHDLMGFGVFAIVLGGVLLAARVFERLWPERTTAVHSSGTVADRSAAAPASAAASRPTDDEGGCHIMYDKLVGATAAGAVWRASLLVAGIVGAVVVAEVNGLTRLERTAERGAAGVRLTADGRDPVALPAFIGTEWVGRRAEVSAIERAILPADTGFSRRHYVSLQPGAHGVFLSVVLSGRDRTSIHRPEVCLVGQGWTLSAPAAAQLHVPGRGALPVTLLQTQLTEPRTGRRVRALVAYTFVSSDAIVATHVQRFLHDAWNRLRHGRADRWAYVLAMADAEDGEAAALGRMQAVFDGVAPTLLAAK